MPKTGVNVVNGYEAIFGFADVILDKRDDFPAFGKPTIPASANIFNTNLTHLSSPGSPFSEKRGTCLVGVENFALPLPPLPP